MSAFLTVLALPAALRRLLREDLPVVMSIGRMDPVWADAHARHARLVASGKPYTFRWPDGTYEGQLVIHKLDPAWEQTVYDWIVRTDAERRAEREAIREKISNARIPNPDYFG